jgi:hypothetical protein
MKIYKYLFHFILLFFVSCRNINENKNINIKIDSSAIKYYPKDYLISSRIGIPDNSPFSFIKQMIGLDMVSLTYYRERDNATKKFDDVINKQVNDIWSISDYIPLQLSSTYDFYINTIQPDSKDTIKIKRGAYFVFFKKESMNNNKWTLYFNDCNDSNKYDTSGKIPKLKNVACIDLNILPGNCSQNIDANCKQSIDSLDSLGEVSIQFTNITENSSILEVGYEKLRFKFKIIFNNNDRIYGSIEKFFKDKKRRDQQVYWTDYLEAANFYSNEIFDTTIFYKNNYIKYSLGWIDTAILFLNYKINEDTSKINNYCLLMKTKAGIFGKLDQYDSAINCYNEAIKTIKGDTSKNKESITRNIKTLNVLEYQLSDYYNNVYKKIKKSH